MTKVAVIYHSVTGTTKQLADAVSMGATLAKADVLKLEIVGTDIIDGRFKNHDLLAALTQVDAMIFGSPTYMGCVSAQFKAFADATGDIWGEQAWSNKLAAGFTIGTNYSGDQLSTIQYMQIFASQHGMLWTGLDIPGNSDRQKRNRLGSQSGLVCHSVDGTLHDADLLTANYLGQRVAELAKKF